MIQFKIIQLLLMLIKLNESIMTSINNSNNFYYNESYMNELEVKNEPISNNNMLSKRSLTTTTTTTTIEDNENDEKEFKIYHAGVLMASRLGKIT